MGVLPGIGGPLGRKPSLGLALLTSAVGSGATTIVIPALAQAGDLCVVCAKCSTPRTPSTPSGWTLFDSAGGFNVGAWGKVLASGDIGASVQFISASDSANGIIAMVFRGNQAIASFAAGATFGSQATTGDPTTQVIASSLGAGNDVLALAHYASFNAISPRTASPEMNEISGANTTQYAKHKIYSATDQPVDHTIDMDDEGAGNFLQSGWLIVV